MLRARNRLPGCITECEDICDAPSNIDALDALDDLDDLDALDDLDVWEIPDNSESATDLASSSSSIDNSLSGTSSYLPSSELASVDLFA